MAPPDEVSVLRVVLRFAFRHHVPGVVITAGKDVMKPLQLS